MAKTILILGGTKEAEQYAKDVITRHPDWRVIMSLAGRTKRPKLPPCETRIGGFGGVEGLAQYLQAQQIDQLVDATHPYALKISHNAEIAAQKTGIPLTKIERPPWEPEDGDHWISVSDIDEAASILPPNARVFLALGRQYISAFEKRDDCHFIVRMVDAPDQPLPIQNYELVISKPNATSEAETALFQKHNVSYVVARNSGGTRSYAKIQAARGLKLPVVMIARPTA